MEQFSPEFKRIGVWLAWLLGVAILTLVVYEFLRPPTGYIKVTYGGPAKSGVFLDVENLSSQAIYVRLGDENTVWPGWAITSCKSPDFSSGDSDPPYIADGTFDFVKISPSGRLQLRALTDLPIQFKGGHCKVRIDLLGGTFAESEEFSPPN